MLESTVDGRGNESYLFAMIPEGAKDWRTVVYLRFYQKALEVKIKEDNNIVWGVAEPFNRRLGMTFRIHLDWGRNGIALYVDDQLVGKKETVIRLPLPDKINLRIGGTQLDPPPVIIDEVRISNVQRDKF